MSSILSTQNIRFIADLLIIPFYCFPTRKFLPFLPIQRNSTNLSSQICQLFEQLLDKAKSK